MIFIDIFVVLSKLFALIKFIVTYDGDVNSHPFFCYTFSAFSPKFGKLFGEVAFRQGGFSARWLFGKMAFRRSGFRQSFVHRKNYISSMIEKVSKHSGSLIQA